MDVLLQQKKGRDEALRNLQQLPSRNGDFCLFAVVMEDQIWKNVQESIVKGHAFTVADAPKTKLHLHRIPCFESLKGNLNAPILTGSTTKPLIQIYLKKRRKTISLTKSWDMF